MYETVHDAQPVLVASATVKDTDIHVGITHLDLIALPRNCDIIQLHVKRRAPFVGVTKCRLVNTVNNMEFPLSLTDEPGADTVVLLDSFTMNRSILRLIVSRESEGKSSGMLYINVLYRIVGRSTERN
jgi:hypothetical protein